jgi:AcrR family transcriptional regulator
MPKAVPRRADAARNLGALLAAAKEVFAEDGVDAPAKTITDRAGVGVGTLYRHFPKRSDLVLAVIRHEIDDCADAAPRLLEAREPWDALTTWIDGLVELVGTKRGLAATLHADDQDPGEHGLSAYIVGRLEPALDGLLAAGRRAGVVRPDVDAAEVLFAVPLLLHEVPNRDLAFGRRLVRVYVDGLRPPVSEHVTSPH